MMYICAWQAPPLQPACWTSSRMAAAADSDRPEPPYSSGIRAERKPASVSAATNAAGYSLSRSIFRQYSPGNCSHRRRTDSRISTWSDEAVADTADSQCGDDGLRYPGMGRAAYSKSLWLVAQHGKVAKAAAALETPHGETRL